MMPYTYKDIPYPFTPIDVQLNSSGVLSWDFKDIIYDNSEYINTENFTIVVHNWNDSHTEYNEFTREIEGNFSADISDLLIAGGHNRNDVYIYTNSPTEYYLDSNWVEVDTRNLQSSTNLPDLSLTWDDHREVEISLNTDISQAIYQDIVNNKLVDIDLVGYADKNIYEDIKQQFYKNIKEYYNNLKINGIKIFLDGSPQSRTAWMREPYIDDDKYYGYGTMKDEEVEEAVKFALTENIQILAHCNGDRACQQYIDTISKFGENAKKIRPVLIHGQFLAEDQIEETKKLGIIPSFFVAHTYYWGDVHIKNFGIDRANKISPLASSLKSDLLFTLHQDSPVIESNMLETIWCATTRETKSGKILGQGERIGVLDAIKAVTINAAYQYFEENLKGSIKEGKIADLVILDKNPLNVEKDEIKDIKIVETIKSGKTIFKL